MGAYYPQGVYIGRVVRHELGESSKKGTPQFMVTFEILEARDNFGDSSRVQSHERSVYIYLTEKSMPIALDALKVLGYRGTKVSALADADFTGKEVELYCKHEDYEGEARERWQINTPREQKESKPVDPMQLRKLDALFCKALKSQAVPDAQPDNDANRAMQEAAVDAELDVPF